MKTKMSKAAKIRKALQAGKSAKVIAQTLNVPVQSVYTEKWKMSKDKPAVKAKVMARRKKVILKAANKVFDKEYKKIVVEKKEPVELKVLEQEFQYASREADKWVTIVEFLSRRIEELRSVEKWAMVEEQNA